MPIMAAHQNDHAKSTLSPIVSNNTITPVILGEEHGDIITAPIEAHTAAGPGLVQEETHASDHDDRSTLIFKRLRRDMKPAGPWLFAAMT